MSGKLRAAIGTGVGLMPATHQTPVVVARFTIPGHPRPKERPRFGKGRTFTPAATIMAETAVLDAFYDTHPFWYPVDYMVHLDITFYRGNRRAVDADNLAKLVQDALNGHAYDDDAQVFDLAAHKFFTTKERARTEVVMSRVIGDRVEL